MLLVLLSIVVVLSLLMLTFLQVDFSIDVGYTTAVIIVKGYSVVVFVAVVVVTMGLALL